MLLRCSAKGYLGGLDGTDKHLLAIPPLEANPASFTTTIDSAQLERYRIECSNTSTSSSSSLQLMLDECVKPALVSTLLERWAIKNAYHLRITQQQQPPTSLAAPPRLKEVRQLRLGTLTSSNQLVEAMLIPTAQTRDELVATPWTTSSPQPVDLGARLVEYVGGTQKVVHTPLSPDLWKYFMLKGSAAADTTTITTTLPNRTPTSFALELHFVLLVDGVSGECRPVDSSSLPSTISSPIAAAPTPKKDPLESLIDTVQDYALGIHNNSEPSPHSGSDSEEEIGVRDQMVTPAIGEEDTASAQNTPHRYPSNTALRDARRKRRTHAVGVHKLLVSTPQPPSPTRGKGGTKLMVEPRELVSAVMAMSLGVVCSRLGNTSTPSNNNTAGERLECSLASHRNVLIRQRMVSTRRALLRRSTMMPSDVEDRTLDNGTHHLPTLVPSLSDEGQRRYNALMEKLEGRKKAVVGSSTATTTPPTTVEPTTEAAPPTAHQEEEIEECMPSTNAPTVKTRTSMRKEEHNSQFRMVGGVQTRISLIGDLKPNHKRGASRPNSPQEYVRRNQRIKRRHLIAGGRMDVSDMYASSSTSTDADTGDWDTPLPGSIQQQGGTTTSDNGDEMDGVMEDTTTVSGTDNETSSSDASSPPPPPPYRRSDGEIPIGIRQGMKSFTRPKLPYPSHNPVSLEVSMAEHRTDMSFAGGNDEEDGDMGTRRGTITPADADEILHSRGSSMVVSPEPVVLPMNPLLRTQSTVRKGLLKPQLAGPPRELERSQQQIGNRALEASEQMEVPETAERLAWNRAYTHQEQTEAESMQTMSRRLGASHQARANSPANDGGGGGTPPEGPDVAPGDWTVPLRPPSCTMRTYTRREHTRAVYLKQYIEHQERVQLQKSKENIIAAMRLLAKMPNYEEDDFDEYGVYEDREPSTTTEGVTVGRATYPPVGAVGARPQGSPILSFKPLCRYGSARPTRNRRPNNNNATNTVPPSNKEDDEVQLSPIMLPNATAPQLPTLASCGVGSPSLTSAPVTTTKSASTPRTASSEGSDRHRVTSPPQLSQSSIHGSSSFSPSNQQGAGYFYFGEVPYGRTSALSFHSDGFASISSMSFNSRPTSSAPRAPGVLPHNNTMPNFAPHRPSVPKNDDGGARMTAIVRKSSRPPVRPPPRAAPIEEDEEEESPPPPVRPINRADTANKTVRFSDMAKAGGNTVAMVEESSSNDLYSSSRANMTITCFAQTRAPPSEPTPLEEEMDGGAPPPSTSSKPNVVMSGIFSTQSGAEWDDGSDDDDEAEEMEAPLPTNLPKRESSNRPKIPVPPPIGPEAGTTAAPRRRTLPQPIFAMELEDEDGEEPMSSPQIGIRRPMSFHVPFSEIPDICIINRTPSVLSARSHGTPHSGSDLEEGTPNMTYKRNSVADTPLSTDITPPSSAVLIST